MKKSLALIGAGYWGKNLARNFYSLGVLHTICDRNEGLSDQYQQQYPDVKMTSNTQVVFDNPEISEIAIAAPAVQHYKLAKLALEAGKDVYVEKPLCLDCHEAEELIELAHEKGKILMVGHLLHYHPCVEKMKEVVLGGELGKIHYISSHRMNLGSYRTEENALWNFAPHDVSVILSLLQGQLPDQVRCTGDAYLTEGVADNSLITLRFLEGVKAHIYVSWLHPFKEQKMVVIGSDGMLVFDDTKPWGEKLLLTKNHVCWNDQHRPIANITQPMAIDPIQKEPLKQECLHFLHCCQERKKPLTDGKEGLSVLQVLQAAEASLNEEGKAKNPAHYGKLKSRYFAHPTAVIEQNANIGDECVIWHFSHIMEGAKIGPKCKLGQNVVVSPGVVLGKNVKVQNNVSLYSGVICEDNVFIGPSAVFTNVINPRSQFPRQTEYQTTLIKRGVSIGANATILCGIELGSYCFIGAGAVVTKDVAPFALVVGNPGKQIGWMSRFGERLDLPLRLPKGEIMTAICPHTNDIYELQGDLLKLVQMQQSELSVR